jgi:hypothetical protein|tara:strand:+ start:4735 stop:5085 length:351 start_codon:yes stop_codon:yes gene_type:complete
MEQGAFIDNIKQWVSLDNKLKVLNEKCKEIREEKGDISDKINVFVENNNLEDNVVEITGGKLKFTKNKSQGAITYKFLEKCLAELFPENQIERIIEHVKNSRETKYEPDIKRYFSK